MDDLHPPEDAAAILQVYDFPFLAEHVRRDGKRVLGMRVAFLWDIPVGFWLALAVTTWWGGLVAAALLRTRTATLEAMREVDARAPLRIRRVHGVYRRQARDRRKDQGRIAARTTRQRRCMRLGRYLSFVYDCGRCLASHLAEVVAGRHQLVVAPLSHQLALV